MTPPAPAPPQPAGTRPGRGGAPIVMRPSGAGESITVVAVTPVRQKLPSWAEAAAGYGLALLAMTATTASVLGGGWVDGAGATLLVAAVAVIEAILLGRSGLPRIAVLLLAIPLCAAVVIPVTIGVIPDDGQSGVRHLLARYSVAAVTGIFETDAWAFTVGLSTLVWLCGYWLGWLAFREHRGILAVLPPVVILAVNALNAPSAADFGLAEAIALTAAVLLIGSVELASLDAGWRWRRVPTLPRLHARFSGSMTLAVIAVVLGGLVLPPATTTDISGHLFPSAGLGGGNGGGGSGGGGGGPSLVEFSINTEPGGPLRSVPRPVLTYYTDQTVSTYLRVVNDTVFAGGNWLPAGAPGGGETIDSSTSRGGSIPRDRSSMILGGATAPVRLHIKAFFTPPTGPQSYALFTGEPDAVSHANTVTGVLDGARHQFLAVDSVSLNVDPNSITSLDSTGLISTATEAQLRAAGTSYPSFVLPDATLTPQRPDDNDPLTVLHDYAVQWTAGTTNNYDAAVAIEQHLRGFTYTLSPPTPPTGEWPIIFFLTSSRKGYCQYFASSMGAMLRSLGIPTRVVSGYGPGIIDEAAGPRPGVVGRQISTSDAHSWVEAYFPGYGWVPFEPTPPSTIGNYQPIGRGPQILTPTSIPTRAGTPAARPNKTPAPDRAAGSLSAPTQGPPLGIWLGPALVLVVLAGAGAVTIVWWRRPRSLGGVWSRLGVAGRFVGVRRDPAETRTAYAERLASAFAGGGRELRARLGQVAAVSGKAEFCRDGIDADEEARWRSDWRDIARAVPPLIRRRLRRR